MKKITDAQALMLYAKAPLEIKQEFMDAVAFVNVLRFFEKSYGIVEPSMPAPALPSHAWCASVDDELEATAGEDAKPVAVELSGIHHAIAEGDGIWRSCTGCYETNEGHPPKGAYFSQIFQCYLGNGCDECGGIGTVWDTTDYDAMADEMAKTLHAVHAAAQPVPAHIAAGTCATCSRCTQSLAAPHAIGPATRDALLDVAIKFIGTLTGMTPPPIEVAPPEVFAPFHEFVTEVELVILAAVSATKEQAA